MPESRMFLALLKVSCIIYRGYMCVCTYVQYINKCYQMHDLYCMYIQYPREKYDVCSYVYT